jgi:hypothetical protein
MKSIARPSFYFSAYPLKAIKSPSPEKQTGSPYLRALLAGKQKSGNQTKARVLSIMNPYPRLYKPAPLKSDKLPKDIELTEKSWFNNYE